MSENPLYWIWLNNVPGIGARRFYKLIEYYQSPEQLFYATDEELRAAAKFLGDKTMAALLELRRDDLLVKARKIMEQTDLTVLTLLSSEYPPLLKAIYDPPPVFIVRVNP